MKFIILFFLIVIEYSQADEIKRIETIVQGISKLREDYAALEEELAIYKYDLRDEKQKNKILKNELKLYSNYAQQERAYHKEIASLKKELQTTKKLLHSKQETQKSKEIVKTVEKKIEKKREKIEEKSIKTVEKNLLPKKREEESIVEFQASSFRLKSGADIYDAIDGKKIARWEKDVSFTSNIKSQNWVKITGYFVERVWRPAQKELWIKLSDVTMRSRG